MATVTGYTAAKMDEISDATVVDGNIVGNNLILVTRDGTQIDAGNVRGPVGPNGPSMIVVETASALPTYTPGTGHNDEVAFVNDANEFRIWTDISGVWTKIASTVPTVVENGPVLLASKDGGALFSHTTPGQDAGLVVTSAGGLVLTCLTDIRFTTPGMAGGGPVLRLPNSGGAIFTSELGIQDDNLSVVRLINTGEKITVFGAGPADGYRPIAASAFQVNSTVLVKEDVLDLPSPDLSRLQLVGGKSYKRKSDQSKETGILIEDLEAAGFHDIIQGEGPEKTYSLSGLVTHLLDAVNELTKKVASLEAAKA